MKLQYKYPIEPCEIVQFLSSHYNSCKNDDLFDNRQAGWVIQQPFAEAIHMEAHSTSSSEATEQMG